MIGLDLSKVLAVIAALMLFGILYNLIIGWAEEKRYLEGYTALAVALGVLITLVGVALVSWQAAVITLGAFVASGTPMLAGSISRYMRARRRDYELIKDEMLKIEKEKECTTN